MNGEKIYRGCYVAMTLWFARKLVDKLGLNTGRLCVVKDCPGEPYVLLGMANRDISPGRTREDTSLVVLTEDDLVATERDIITLAEAAYIDPEKYGRWLKHPTFNENRKHVAGAISRIRKLRKLKKVHK